MAFRRGLWRCKVLGCAEDAAVSVMVVVATPGKQLERVKKASTAVRLCQGDLNGLCAGEIPGVLLDAIRNVVQVVTGVKWEPPKPKRIK